MSEMKLEMRETRTKAIPASMDNIEFVEVFGEEGSTYSRIKFSVDGDEYEMPISKFEIGMVDKTNGDVLVRMSQSRVYNVTHQKFVDDEMNPNYVQLLSHRAIVSNRMQVQYAARMDRQYFQQGGSVAASNMWDGIMVADQHTLLFPVYAVETESYVEVQEAMKLMKSRFSMIYMACPDATIRPVIMNPYIDVVQQ